MSQLMDKPPAQLREPYTQPIERIMRKVWDRLNEKNEHFMGCLVGREGIGKSFTAIKIATLVDPQFTHDQVFFYAEDILKLLRDDEYRPGAVYVLDEAGVSFGNRTWHDRAQILANQAFQLIRSHNIGLIFALPVFADLDSQVQGRLQALYELNEKATGEYVSGSWYWIDVDRKSDNSKIYKKYPRTPNGNRITELQFSPPPDSVTAPYEERKNEFQEQVYDKVIEESQAEDSGDTKDPVEIAENIRSEEGAQYYTREINNGAQVVLDAKMIANNYDIGMPAAKRVKTEIREEIDDDVL